MALKGILLDKDGTLIDFNGTWGPAALEVMRELAGGDRAALDRLIAVSDYEEAARRFRPSSPLVAGSSASWGPLWAGALGREATPAFYAEIDRRFAHWGLATLAPIGRPATVARRLAAAGFALGIATNDAEHSARLQAEALGLTALIPFVVGYDSGFGGKPGPGMVLAFARAFGLRTDEVALVGDSLHDLHAARAAGALAVAVLTGPRGAAARDEVAPHADHVLASIADLPDWAARLALKA